MSTLTSYASGSPPRVFLRMPPISEREASVQEDRIRDKRAKRERSRLAGALLATSLPDQHHAHILNRSLSDRDMSAYQPLDDRDGDR